MTPHKRATRSSFHQTFNASDTLISRKAMPRMTRVLDWEPALPPVSVSMGINVIRMGSVVRACSKLPRMVPEIISEIISTNSQTIRFFAICSTEVFR